MRKGFFWRRMNLNYVCKKSKRKPSSSRQTNKQTGAKYRQGFKYTIILHGMMRKIFGLKSRCWLSWFLSQRFRRKCISLLFPASRGHCILWLMIYFLYLQSHHSWQIPSHAAISLVLSFLPPFPTFDDTGPSWKIQDNLPISRSAKQ